jgi:hypothetical protein
MMTAEAINDEARQLLLFAAGAQRPDETKEAMLARAARRLEITFNRARDIYHRRARLIAAHEYMNLRTKALEAARAELDRQNAELRLAEARAAALEERAVTFLNQDR